MNRKEKRKTEREKLGKIADQLIDEVWEGKWNHVQNLDSTPIGEWPLIIDEFKIRCPNHTQEEYIDSLKRSMITRR